MKKIFYLMGLCALAFISCQKEEIAGNDFVEGTYTYEFVAYQQPEAKATIGDKAEGKWPVLWSVGDQMGVYKADGTFVGVATIADECAGLNEGKFSVLSDVALVEGDALYFSYPYVENAAISTGKIAAKQTLGASGVGANAVAYGEVEYNPGNTQFVLNHTNAYLKFNIKSEEFAGYNLNGVTLWATGAELSGDVTVADQLTVTNAGDYVKSTLATPVVVSADNAQAVWVTALPGDLAGKTVYAIVHMTGVEGTETATHTVTLPVKLNGAGALPAGSVTEINLPSLTKSLAPAWYEPIETRYIAAYGEGWSYGAENTVLFETISNVTETVELKARGNFMKVTEPKYVQLQYACDREHGNYININGSDAAYASSKYAEFELNEYYTITAKPRKKQNNYGFLAGLLIKDANKNVIWGLNLWASYSTPTKELVDYTSGRVMPYNLGAGPVGNSYDKWYMNGVYFQWGRPFAFPWSTTLFSSASIENVKPNLETSAQNPYTMYYYSDASYNDWYYERGLDDLWGNPSANDGIKSIFDPCPKGYRVISPAIVQELMNEITVSDGVSSFTNNITYNTEGKTNYNFTFQGVEWPFASGFFNNNGSAQRSAGDGKSLAAYWTNSVSANNGYVFFYQNNSAGTVTYKNNSGKATAFPVRCMVDTENR